jgi:hypothetical protein
VTDVDGRFDSRPTTWRRSGPRSRSGFWSCPPMRPLGCGGDFPIRGMTGPAAKRSPSRGTSRRTGRQSAPPSSRVRLVLNSTTAFRTRTTRPGWTTCVVVEQLLQAVDLAPRRAELAPRVGIALAQGLRPYGPAVSPGATTPPLQCGNDAGDLIRRQRWPVGNNVLGVSTQLLGAYCAVRLGNLHSFRLLVRLSSGVEPSAVVVQWSHPRPPQKCSR